MKIVAFSDLHAHPFPAYDSRDQWGRSVRLMDAIKCIHQVREYAHAVGADLVLFGGDLFHERRHIITQAFNEVFNALLLFQASGMPLVMIHGNHDQADREGTVHAIEAMNVFSTVINVPGWYQVEGKEETYTLCAVPYLEDKKALKKLVKNGPSSRQGPSIFLGHLGINGAEIGADFIYREKVEAEMDDLRPENFDLGLLGHFHKHQHLGDNFYYIGSPLQHNWGDVGQKRGLIEYDFSTETLSHVELQAPKFTEITAKEAKADPSLLEDNFVRLVDGDKETKAWAKEHTSAREVEVKAVKKAEIKKERLPLKQGDSNADLLKKYLAHIHTKESGLDKARLLDIGVGILKELQ